MSSGDYGRGVCRDATGERKKSRAYAIKPHSDWTEKLKTPIVGCLASEALIHIINVAIVEKNNLGSSNGVVY